MGGDEVSDQSKKRPGEPKEIPDLFAGMAVRDGDEGITGFLSSQGWMPLVFSKRSSIELLYGSAVAEYKRVHFPRGGGG
jgi:hypothetical protein